MNGTSILELHLKQNGPLPEDIMNLVTEQANLCNRNINQILDRNRDKIEAFYAEQFDHDVKSTEDSRIPPVPVGPEHPLYETLNAIRDAALSAIDEIEAEELAEEARKEEVKQASPQPMPHLAPNHGVAPNEALIVTQSLEEMYEKWMKAQTLQLAMCESLPVVKNENGVLSFSNGTDIVFLVKKELPEGAGEHCSSPNDFRLQVIIRIGHSGQFQGMYQNVNAAVAALKDFFNIQL